jgi:hypothetical protein
MRDTGLPKRGRRAIAVALVAAAATAAMIACARTAPAHDEKDKTADLPSNSAAPPDWDFLVGRWAVKHRRLKARLAGSTEWEEFNGTSVLSTTLGGAGNVDDNVIELPSGTYRAMGFRAFDPKTGRWSIWWLDARHPTTIDPPVRGGFRDGIGTFVGDDTLNGRPIKVRFLWSRITANSAHWEQAFSADGGVTWETNWVMDFTRLRS